jgi:site-specific DNA recombinase
VDIEVNLKTFRSPDILKNIEVKNLDKCGSTPYVYKILNNPVYIGIAAHKGQHFPGEHQAIIEQSVWDQVQAHLKSGRHLAKGPSAARGSKAPSLLRGLLFSEEGRAFTPGWTAKGQKHYRYYINTASIKLGKTGCEVQRVPAGEIETAVLEKVRHLLRSPEILSQAVREVIAQRPEISEAEAIQALQSIDPVWDLLFPAEQATIVQTLIKQITIRANGMSIQWQDQGMSQLLRNTLSSSLRAEAA